jgi:hypothetical protein
VPAGLAIMPAGVYTRLMTLPRARFIRGYQSQSCIVVPRRRWLVLVACIVAIEKEGLLALVSKRHLSVKPHGRAGGSSPAKEGAIPPSLAS